MITEKAFRQAAESLGCEVAAIKAVAKVESNGSGFDAEGLPKILFEAHKFSKYTEKKFNATNAGISSTSWNKALYSKTNRGEHARLAQAVSLDRNAALKSASWGAFQILGSNWKACGFASLQDFINAMYKDEDSHLQAFVEFIKSEGLADFLRNKQWSKFASKFNGPAYKANAYDTKMAAAYRAFS